MTFYVESNFVLEIARGQEEHQEAETLLTAAEGRTIDLSLPAMALFEPMSTIMQRARTRERLVSQLNQQVAELGRSLPHQSDVAILRPIPALLAQVERRESDRLLPTITRVLAASRTIHVSSEILADCAQLRSRFGLSPADALVLASIQADLNRQTGQPPHIFVSRNWKDFDDPDIRRDLARLGCSFLRSFQNALQHLPAAT